MKCRNLHRFIMLLPYIAALFNIGVLQAALDNKGIMLLPYIAALFNIGVLQTALDNKGIMLLSCT